MDYQVNHNVFDIASYILNAMGKMTTMKLQKLVYYCQAWSLVWDDKPLFIEKIEAWANGPVIPELYQYHKGNYYIESIDDIKLKNSEFSQEELNTIDSVLEFYGDKSSHWLSELTHREDPWKKSRGELLPHERTTREIPLELMYEYYDSISNNDQKT